MDQLINYVPSIDYLFFTTRREEEEEE